MKTDYSDILERFISDIPDEYLSAPEHYVEGGSFRQGAEAVEASKLTEIDLLQLMLDVQQDVIEEHLEGEPWPLCPIHADTAAPHELTPDLEGWTCESCGATWPFGSFAQGHHV